MKRLILFTLSTLFLTIGLFGQNNALHFDGVDDYVEMNNPLFGNIDFTVEMWFESESTNNGPFNRLISLEGSGSRFEIGEDNGEIAYFVFPNNSNTGNHSTVAGTEIRDGNCHHIASVKSSSDMILFLDGQQILFIEDHFDGNFSMGGESLRLGRWGTSAGEYWAGSIDEIRVWNDERTQIEIQENMSIPLLGTESNLILNFDCNQGVADGNNNSETTIISNSIYGYTGDLNNFSLSGISSNWIQACSSISEYCPSICCNEGNDEGFISYPIGALQTSLPSQASGYYKESGFIEVVGDGCDEDNSISMSSFGLGNNPILAFDNGSGFAGPITLFETGKHYCISLCQKINIESSESAIGNVNMMVYNSSNNSFDIVSSATSILDADGWVNSNMSIWQADSDYSAVYFSVNGTWLAGGSVDIGIGMLIDNICISEVDAPSTCQADFTYDILDCGEVCFTDASCGEGYSTEWIVEGNNFSSNTNPCYDFTGTGTYEICLTIEVDECVSTICKNIEIVFNTIDPTIICPSFPTVSSNTNGCETSIQLDDPTVELDLCATVSEIVCTRSDGFELDDNFPVGITTITCTVTDNFGNSATCSEEIEITDETPPTIECGGDILVENAPSTGSTITWPSNSSSDNCGVETTYCSYDDEYVFPCGETTVWCYAVDTSGNMDSCSFLVVVECVGGVPPFNCGSSIITCFSGFNSGAIIGSNPINQSDIADDFVLALVDFRNHSNAPFGSAWNGANSPHPIYHHDSWKSSNVGQVFGLAIDDDYNVYVTASTIHGQMPPGGLTNAGPGTIYKINRTTGNISAWANLPNSLTANGNVESGLGNICFDTDHQRFFVSNFLDGKIYSLDINGNILESYDPPLNDNPINGQGFHDPSINTGFESLGQRIWGIGYHNDKLYFSVWGRHRYRNVTDNELWSVSLVNGVFPSGINSNGDKYMGATKEKTLSYFLNPVSDIAFTCSDEIILASKTMYLKNGGGATKNGDFNHWDKGYKFAHYSKIIKYDLQSLITSAFYSIGSGAHDNCSGGIDIGYGSFDPLNGESPSICDQKVWATADALVYKNTVPKNFVYGVTGVPINGNNNGNVSTTSIYIDVDNNSQTAGKTFYGDIEVFKCGCCSVDTTDCSQLAITYEPIIDEETMTCCYSALVTNNVGPEITKICLNLDNTPEWIINTASLSPGYSWGDVSSDEICIKNDNGFPVGTTDDIFSFCLSEIDDAVMPADTQCIITSWYNGAIKTQCQDTTKLVCDATPGVQCMVIDSVEVLCNPENDYSYCLCFDVQNKSGEPATNLVLDVLTSGFDFINGCNSTGFLNNTTHNWEFGFSGIFGEPSPMMIDDVRTFCVNVLASSIVQPATDVDFQLTLHNLENCCSEPLTLSVELNPCCDPCESISSNIQINEMGTDSTCCYTLDINNDCGYQYFTKVEVNLLTEGVAFGSIINGLPVDWSVCGVSDQKICMEPSLTGTIPKGSISELLQFCLTDVNEPSEVPQMVSIKYFALDDNQEEVVVCDSVLIELDCPVSNNPCAFVFNEVIECDQENGVYNITLDVQNLSNPSFTAYYLTFNPPSLNPFLTPNQVPLNPLAPGSTQTVNFTYEPALFPDADNMLILAWYLKGSNGDSCCAGHELFLDTLILPDCTILDPCTITCPDTIIVSCCGTVELPTPTLDGDCEGITVECIREDGNLLSDPFDIGSTMITCTLSNEESCTYFVTITGELPTITCPADLTINEGDSTDPMSIGMATTLGECSTENLDYTDDIIGGEDCPYTILRTWTATTECGQILDCVQNILVECDTMTTDSCDISCFLDGTKTTILNPSIWPRDMVTYNNDIIIIDGFSGLKKWDGTALTNFGNQLNSPRVLIVHNGDLYAGGNFNIPGTSNVLLAKYDDVLLSWNSLLSINNNQSFVRTLHSSNYGLIIGGSLNIPSTNPDLTFTVKNMCLYSNSVFSEINDGGQSGVATSVREVISIGNKIYVVSNSFDIYNFNTNSFSNTSATLSGAVTKMIDYNGSLIVFGQHSITNNSPSCVGTISEFATIYNEITDCWSEFGGGFSNPTIGINPYVSDAKVLGDIIILTGRTEIAGGVPINKTVFMWDGTSWSELGGVDPTIQIPQAMACRTGTNGKCEIYSGGEVGFNVISCDTIAACQTTILDLSYDTDCIEINEKIELTWTNQCPDKLMNISLINCSTNTVVQNSTIFNIPNIGTYAWMSPVNSLSPGMYQLYIECVDGSFWDYGPCFQIGDCDPLCTCSIFNSHTVQYGSLGTQVNCGGVFEIETPVQNFSIDGFFECNGMCTTDEVSWTLTSSSGTISGTSNTGAYSILMSGTNFAVAGTYIFSVIANCDGDQCNSCVIVFNVTDPICTCDSYSDVTLTTQDNTYSLDCAFGVTTTLDYCPQIDPILSYSGTVNCSVACMYVGGTFNWSLEKEGLPYVIDQNMILQNQAASVDLNGNYIIDLSTVPFWMSGHYTINSTVLCDPNTKCDCFAEWVVPDECGCECNQIKDPKPVIIEDFTNINSCVRKFHLENVGPCDIVEWRWVEFSFGAVDPPIFINGNANDQVTFTGTDDKTYFLYATVQRILSDGTYCQEYITAAVVPVNCGPIDNHQFYYDGLLHTQVGDYTLNNDVLDDKIFLSEFQSTEKKGLDIALGEAGGHVFTHESPHHILNSEGGYFEYKIYGTVNTEENILIRTITEEVVNQIDEKYISLSIGNEDTDQNWLRVTTPTDGIMVDVNIDNNAPIFFRSIFSDGFVELVYKNAGHQSGFYTKNETTLMMPNGNTFELPVWSKIEFEPIDPTDGIAYYSDVEMRWSGLSADNIYEEKIIMFDDQVANQALGNIVYDAWQVDNKLGILNPPKNMYEGVQLSWPYHDEIEKSVAHENIWESRMIALFYRPQLDLKALGSIDALDSQNLGTWSIVRIEEGIFDIVFDNENIVSDKYKYQVFENGILNGEISLTSDFNTITVDLIPNKGGNRGNGKNKEFGFTLGWSESIVFNIDGKSFNGNELRLILEDTRLINIEKFNIIPKGFDEFTIINERVFPDTTVAVDQVEKTRELFSCFPNPTTNQLTISAQEPIPEPVNIKLYDITGRKVKELSYNKLGKETTLSLEGITNGVYLLELNTTKGTIFRTKIIKL